MLGEILPEADLEMRLGFCVYGVCIVGTLKAERGLERLGIGALVCDEDDSEDALDLLSVAGVGAAKSLSVAWGVVSGAMKADFRRRWVRGSRVVGSAAMSL